MLFFYYYYLPFLKSTTAQGRNFIQLLYGSILECHQSKVRIGFLRAGLPLLQSFPFPGAILITGKEISLLRNKWQRKKKEMKETLELDINSLSKLLLDFCKKKKEMLKQERQRIYYHNQLLIFLMYRSPQPRYLMPQGRQG